MHDEKRATGAPPADDWRTIYPVPKPRRPLTVRLPQRRLAPQTLERFARTSTGWISDANGKTGALSSEMRSLSLAAGFCGSALTVAVPGGDNMAPFAALRYARPGDVLVIATDGQVQCSVVGDLFVAFARNAGISAIVTNGLVRDIEGIRAVGLPVVARGLNPNAPSKEGGGEIGGAVVLDGATIECGDLVRGDADGVVVVSWKDVQKVCIALDRVQQRETLMESWVAQGMKAPPWLEEVFAAGMVDEIPVLSAAAGLENR